MSIKSMSTAEITPFNYNCAKEQALKDMGVSKSVKENLKSLFTNLLNQELNQDVLYHL